MKKKKRHLEPWEIARQCKQVARERRMCDRTPWSAAGIICGYVLLKCEGFKGKRIANVTNKINQMEAEFDAGKINVNDLRDNLLKKAEWSVDYEPYTEDDIHQKKGSYDWWIDQRQIDPQNAINKMTTRYMLFFYTVLMEEYGYGKDRLTRVCKYIEKILIAYQENKVEISSWKRELLEEAGVVFEMPVDPLTQTEGSMMTGC